MLRALSSAANPDVIQLRNLLLVASICSAVGLVGCSQESGSPTFNSTDITGAEFGNRFDLVDHQGQARQLGDFQGDVVVLFFGFTHCPDVCPTTLAEFNAVLAQLDEAAAQRVQVLFVTVDPERDTPEVLRDYVTAFNPEFLGLTGTPEQIADVAREFRIIYKKVEGSRPGQYSVDHSAGTYIFDPQGRIRLYARYGQGHESLAQDIERLLDS